VVKKCRATDRVHIQIKAGDEMLWEEEAIRYGHYR
jgi:hypothetical protein